MISGVWKLAGLHPAVYNAAHYGLSYLDAHGISTTVTSGFRTHAEQQRLYDLYRKGKGAAANRPGTSAHEFGLAFDVTAAEGSHHSNQRWVREVMLALGFASPYPKEPWHFEVPQWQRYVGRAPS